MKLNNTLHRSAVLLCMLLYAIPSVGGDPDRWYSQEHVKRGAKVFATYCAECHGASAEGQSDWHTKAATGKTYPPPLDGSASTWHRNLEDLRRIIRDSEAHVATGKRSAAKALSAGEIDETIAFFQSKWSDNLYHAWMERTGEAGKRRRALFPADTPSPATAGLQRILPGVDIGAPEPTPVPRVYQVKVGDSYVYVTRDGGHAFVGDLVDLTSGKNLSESSRNRDRASLMATFPERDMIVYPAVGDEKTQISVFTDASCPYCRQLHREVPALQKAGITVRYIAFPRSGTRGTAYQTMRAVWCARDRRQALDVAKGIDQGELGVGDCADANAVDAGYRLGQKVGIRGTPAVVLSDGSIQFGYMPTSQLLARLGLSATDGEQQSKIDP